MKGVLAFASIVALSLVTPGLLFAQGNTEVGTWTLNVAKSKYVGQQAPKNETRIYEVTYAGVKVSVDGVAGDGSRILYTYTTKYDDKDSPIYLALAGVGDVADAAEGIGTPNGADTIAVKRVDADTTTATLKKAGKVVQTTTTVISGDGKIMTITSKGTNEQGKPTTVTTVWDKQ